MIADGLYDELWEAVLLQFDFGESEDRPGVLQAVLEAMADLAMGRSPEWVSDDLWGRMTTDSEISGAMKATWGVLFEYELRLVERNGVHVGSRRRWPDEERTGGG